MVNPYFCYGIAFSTALLMYLMGWSELYPALSVALLSFLILSIIVHLVLGVRFRLKGFANFSKLPFRPGIAPWFVTVFLFGLWFAEFVHAGGIPLLMILFKQPYDYKLFGIPTLHVFIVTFSSFYTIFLFHLYLSSRSGQILFLYTLNLIAAILIYNRGMLLFNLSASAMLFLIYQGRLSRQLFAAGIPATIIILFFFGMLGTLRVAHESGTTYSNEGFLKTGGASDTFRNSGIPPEFFWAYIYTTSPLANLQQNVALNDPPPFGISTTGRWLNNEVIFDFISKRINYVTGQTRAEQKMIPGPFNACTVYSGSYSYLGWTGLILMAILIVAVPPILIRILPPSSPFFLTSLTLLNTMFLFMIFDNTIRFTGLSFQLMYPLVLHAGAGRFPWVRRIFSLG